MISGVNASVEELVTPYNGWARGADEIIDGGPARHERLRLDAGPRILNLRNLALPLQPSPEWRSLTKHSSCSMDLITHQRLFRTG
jgi:hypothetical protein